MALSIGMDMASMAFNPRLHIRKDKVVITNTHFLYETFAKSVEKYCDIEFIKPTQVVRQASVKMAARRTAPGAPKT